MRRSHNSIGSKMTFTIVGVSSLFALLTIMVQLWWNYHSALDNAVADIDRYTRSLLPSMSHALWDVDQPLLKDLVSGVGVLPSVSGLELSSRDGVYLNLGQGVPVDPGHRYLLLHYPLSIQEQAIAELTVALDRQQIYLQLGREVMVIVLGNGLKMLLVIYIILTLANRLIVRRVEALANFADGINLSELTKLRLDPKVAESRDEIGLVAQAFSRMYQRMRHDYALVRRQQRALTRHQQELSQTVEERTARLRWQTDANRQLAQISLGFLNVSVDDIASLLAQVVRQIGELLQVERVSVVEFEDDRLHYRAFWSCIPNAQSADEQLTDVARLKRRFTNNSMIIIEDVESISGRWPEEYRELSSLGIRGIAGFAIMDGDALVGVLALAQVSGHLEWNDDKSQLLTQFAATLNALLIRRRREGQMLLLQRQLLRANARLAKQAATDELTGLVNRRPFSARLEQALGTEALLLMMDVDFFKHYNDSYGHPAGDEVLRRLAQALKQALPEDALLARIGGEEFAAVCPGQAPEVCRQLPQRLLDAVRELNIPHGASPHGRVSLSLGVVNLLGVDSVRDAMGRADACLYRAKALGRNRAEWEEH
ncbi:diguanylate cyclase domain-containing protein [Shewanella cyperi]|uniref:diguanylate cyclase domain-containing protein n=1 Tax=Shewanella cyperi TaxID=2814292 RepID=UPI001A95282D|nr:diguanylate cyclase [Shewanella cyperi]QSX40581.1 diguanylate cyclase [Shewanella cyperi]